MVRCLGLGHFGLFAIAILSSLAELFLDTEKLVVLGHTVRAACGTGLDLSGVGSNGDVSDGGVLGLTRTVGDNGGVTVALSELYGTEGLGERADLVNLHEDGVGAAEFDTLLEVLHVGNEEVVANELAAVADEIGEDLPAFPVVLVHTVLDGVDGVLLNELLEELGLLGGGELGSVGTLLPGVVVYAVLVELGGSAVETDGHVLAGYVAGELDSLDDDVESVLGAVKCGSETTLVTYSGGEATVMKHFLEVVEYLGAHADTFLEAACADGTDHELLEADGGVGVCTAVDDVHHGNGKHVAVAATDIFVEGEVEVVSSSLGNGERYAEDGVGAEVALGVGAVECEHGLVNLDLVKSAHALEGLGDGTVYVGHSLGDTLAHVAAFVTVAELEGLVLACGCARGYGCAATCAALEDYVYFNGGIAT